MSTSTRLMKARDILQKAHERRYAIEQGVDGMPLELREAYRAEEQAKMAYGAAKAALYREEAERIAASDPEYRRLYRRAEAYRATLAKVAGVRALVRKAATEARRPTGFFGELGETGDGVYGAIRSGLEAAIQGQLTVVNAHIHVLEGLATEAQGKAEAYLEERMAIGLAQKGEVA